MTPIRTLRLVFVGLLCGACAHIELGGGHHAHEAESPQVLRHVVLFKFNDEASAEEIRRIETAFCALPSQIDAIHDFEWGTDIGVTDKTEGFTHCYVLTFRSEADLAVYLPHPAHEAFRDLLRPHLDKVIVVDYWTKE